jgi:hypothetical protein
MVVPDELNSSSSSHIPVPTLLHALRLSPIKRQNYPDRILFILSQTDTPSRMHMYVCGIPDLEIFT